MYITMKAFDKSAHVAEGCRMGCHTIRGVKGGVCDGAGIDEVMSRLLLSQQMTDLKAMSCVRLFPSLIPVHHQYD